jgi:hypothetical protein
MLEIAKKKDTPMKLSLFLPRLAIAAALAFAPGFAIRAEPLPMPTIDFEVQGTTLHGGQIQLRHTAGKMRVEVNVPNIGQPITGFIDLRTRKVVLLLPIPGVANTAIEADYDFGFGQVIGNAERTGDATVAGEPCTLWRVSTEHGTATTCLAKDNIPLKTEAVVEGKQHVVFEATLVKRERQNPADFELPAGTSIIKMPKGLKNIPGIPGLN